MPCSEVARPRLDQPFVAGALATPAGETPVVPATLTWRDRLGALAVRSRIGRTRYLVDPGLYALGSPDPAAPVLVTANYKLTFDTLRADLRGRDLWILALDTRGINVWCAAGKGTFGTDELCRSIEAAGLARVVEGRTLVLPQLGAPGVAAHEVRRRSGFRVVYGPVRSADLPAFLDAGMRASDEMRRVSFPLRDRLVLVPVELVGGLALAAAVSAGAAIAGGIGPGWYSIARAVQRAPIAGAAGVAALLFGTVVAPALLPWLPGRMFSAKGALVALAPATLFAATAAARGDAVSWLAAALFAIAGASFATMNFTGTSTFTSQSGVQREMSLSLPWQIAGAAVAAVLWLAGGWYS